MKILPKFRFYNPQADEAVRQMCTFLIEEKLHESAKILQNITNKALVNRGAYNFWLY